MTAVTGILQVGSAIYFLPLVCGSCGARIFYVRGEFRHGWVQR